jgi:uncharacterized protein (TIGR02147 family)
MQPDIFQYTDYGLYLNDWVASCKRSGTNFSYSTLAQKLDLGSKVQVYRILRGQRKTLNADLQQKWIEVIGLGKREARYFGHLVRYKETQDAENREKELAALTRIRLAGCTQSVDRHAFAYLREWYMPVLRELMPMLPSQASLHDAGKALCPPVSEAQVENALDVLLSLGFLRRENGGYRQGQAHIHVPEDLRRKAVRDFQARMMERGVELLRSEGDGHRRFTTATMGIPAAKADLVVEKIRLFQQEMAELVESLEGAPDQVFQLNVQFFNVSEFMGRKS